MRRRLDLAAGSSPAAVLFLDEPTTGLDPRVGSNVDIIRQLVTSGVTLLLTTQYLDEPTNSRTKSSWSTTPMIADGTPATQAKVGGADSSDAECTERRAAMPSALTT